ncbi:16S rRNA (adenine(1518)-N(6)/adenine(1519)-N(6))-dimethyltransferase RsmA [Oleidesulfovibrio alaskensis]|jgi:16S rRNA (adenine1518-N6/adenine1519-N6)-dimethyltransferase|uniref:16S rRNA (adenine(1518)-N(6)/adenine(1519)-N(6))- dimethyltransferase RsmA n=1 Tax=Oleidesulfovibrio alaskensis TaxID=58180 RepID=UPI001A3A49EE|nr:16S rRNA (adenine(1518)-N(6)/adenine(1519)-N(6))-dimethyltransferase RsmA [Oleidesulfovibrio alaskensis]MBL3582731.1 16S rRNA (adenine(1518)-N(6)/adenine(1519)-N(6))-dimethyltransferase RsmA [Oleidesulfovibrio alaskensis]
MIDKEYQHIMTERTASAPRAKKSLGQNFLQDKNISAKIVAALQIGPADCVIEIGPGPGALTDFIQKAAPASLWLLEKDTYWAGEHRRSDSRTPVEKQVVLTDALTFPWERLSDDRSWKLIGNLPYNVASPLMWDCLSLAAFSRAVFMIQKEVGDRIVAAPRSRQYGALSVWLQSHTVPRKELIVPPTVFKPRPKVDSAVLSFAPLPLSARNFSPRALSVLLKICFQQRRKQLQKILKRYWSDAVCGWFELQGVPPAARPEELSPNQFQQLANLLESQLVS